MRENGAGSERSRRLIQRGELVLGQYTWDAKCAGMRRQSWMGQWPLIAIPLTAVPSAPADRPAAAPPRTLMRVVEDRRTRVGDHRVAPVLRDALMACSTAVRHSRPNNMVILNIP